MNNESGDRVGPVIILLTGMFLLGMVLPAHAQNAKASRLLSTYGVTNVSESLLRLHDQARSGSGSLVVENITGLDVATGRLKRRFSASDDGVVIDIVADAVSDNLLARITEAGARVRSSSPKYRRITATVSEPYTLIAIGRLAGVRSVQPVFAPVLRAGSVTSRAVTALGSAAASATHAVDGTGTLIGIVSDSFARTGNVRDGNTTPAAGLSGTLAGSIPQDSGDLPAAINLLSDSEAGTDEGAGMAELVHDIAPGAALAFHDAGQAELDMAVGIDRLCALSGMSIVVDDIGYPAEAYYQDDLISQAASQCVEAGVAFFSAAGNDGDAGFRQVFRDMAADDNEAVPPDGNDFHDWDAGAGKDGFLGIQLAPGASVLAILQWNQPNDSISPGKGAEIDLDLYVSTSEDVAGIFDASFELQGTTNAPQGDAVEGVIIENATAGVITRYLAIDHFAGRQGVIPQDAGTPLEFRLILLGPLGDFITEYAGDGPTIWGHPYASGVVGVAAVPWWEAPAFDPAGFGPTANIDPEEFTSRGGVVPVQFDRDGNFSAQTRTTPVLAAVDGNNTTFFGQLNATAPLDGEEDGFPNFFGTSAAAPNAAAVGLLMLERNEGLTPADITSVLATTAIDVTGDRAAAGPDNVTGAGLIDAVAALNAIDANERPVADAGPDQAVAAGDTVTLDGSGSNDTDGTIVSYAWQQINATPVGLSDATATMPTFTAPDANLDIVFELTVTDDDGAVSRDRVTISVTSVNNSPTADAGRNQSVLGNAVVTLDGSASSDPEGPIASYLWRQTAGRSVTLSDAAAVQPSFTAPNVNTELSFELTVTDADGAQASDSVNVTVTRLEDSPGGGDGSEDDGTPLGGSGFGGSRNSGSGCTLGAGQVNDPLFFLLVILSLWMTIFRRKADASH